MLRPGHVKQMQQVLHEHIKVRLGLGEALVDRVALLVQVLDLLRAQRGQVVEACTQGGHGFVAFRVLLERDQVVAVGVDLDHAALGCQLAYAVVVQVARVRVDCTAAGVGRDDRCGGQRQHLVEHRVAGVGHVQQDAQAVGPLHQVTALGAKAFPFRQGGGGIRQVVVHEVHQAEHPQPLAVVGVQQFRVGTQRVSVFHADKHHALALGCDAPGVVGGKGEGEAVGVAIDHITDARERRQPIGAGVGAAFFGARTLWGVDREEAAIQAAFAHTRQVDLATVLAIIVALDNVPAGAGQREGCVEVTVQHQ